MFSLSTGSARSQIIFIINKNNNNNSMSNNMSNWSPSSQAAAACQTRVDVVGVFSSLFSLTLEYHLNNNKTAKKYVLSHCRSSFVVCFYTLFLCVCLRITFADSLIEKSM